MKIAHIESSPYWGGQELRILEQMEWLLANGHETLLIARPESEIYQRAVQRNLRCVAMSLTGSAKPSTIYQLYMLVKKERFDILDCHSSRDASYSAIIKWLTGQTVIRSRHITNPVKATFSHCMIWKYGNDSIITTAELVNQRILEKGLAPSNKLYIQEAGVDEKRFNPEVQLKSKALKQELEIPHNHRIIANIGMIRPDKGQMDFIKAATLVANQFPNTTFLQIGEATAATQKYKEKVIAERDLSNHKEQIRFIGYHDNIEEYLGLCDIVVIASTGTEARTRLVPQAFLCQANIIATRVGGLPEMIEQDKTGLLCETKSPHDIARNICRLLQDPVFADELKLNAFTHAQQHLTTDKMMHGILSTYKRAITSNHKS